MHRLTVVFLLSCALVTPSVVVAFPAMASETQVQARFATSLLHRLGIRPTNENVRFLVGWQRAEGGHFHNDARFNPLNTTQNMPGSGDTGSQGNISQYRNWNQGLKATKKTLTNGLYNDVLRAMRGGSAGQMANALVNSRWGTTGLVRQTVASTHGVHPTKRGLGGTRGGTGGGGGARAAGGPGIPSLADELGPLGGPDLSGLLPQRTPPPVSGPSEPAFSARARLPMPNGAQLVPAASGPPAPRPSILERVAQVQAQTDPQLALTTLAGRGAGGARRGGGGGGGGAAGGPGRVLPNTSRTLAEMFDIAERVDKLNNRGKLPYQWGGGHGSRPAEVGEEVDCSGFVSQVLGVSPRVSGQFAASWGKPGAGKWVTVYANGHHVLMSMRDPDSGKVRWFGTSQSNPGGGAGEIAKPSAAYLASFTKRHPGRR